MEVGCGPQPLGECSSAVLNITAEQRDSVESKHKGSGEGDRRGVRTKNQAALTSCNLEEFTRNTANARLRNSQSTDLKLIRCPETGKVSIIYEASTVDSPCDSPLVPLGCDASPAVWSTSPIGYDSSQITSQVTPDEGCGIGDEVVAKVVEEPQADKSRCSPGISSPRRPMFSSCFDFDAVCTRSSSQPSSVGLLNSVRSRAAGTPTSSIAASVLTPEVFQNPSMGSYSMHS